MDHFETLGRRVEDRWRRVEYDERVFAELAYVALAEDPPRASTVDLARWLLSLETLPLQQVIEGVFGQPAVTVWRGRRCFIDVYFWLDGTTAIHQHGFAGAFHVLAGSSLHGDYRFRETRRMSSAFLLGELELRSMRLLPAGTTLPIVPGEALIHSLFHLERPSVSVVIRNPGPTHSAPAYEYRWPGLALDPFHEDVTTTKALQLITMLHRAGEPAVDDLTGDLLERADLHTAYLVLRRCLSLRGLRVERLDTLLARVARAHGDDAVAHLAGVLDEDARLERLVRLREMVHGPDSRFILAVLRSAPGRQVALELLAERWPDEEPLTRIDRFVDELAGLGVNDPEILEPLFG
jgi:hypothetical protein